MSFVAMLLTACPGDPPPLAGFTSGDGTTTSSTGPTSASSTTMMAETDGTTGGSSGEEDNSLEGGSSEGPGDSTGVMACQMQMNGADALEFVAHRDDRMPTLAETHALVRTIGSSAAAASIGVQPPEPQGGTFIVDPDWGGTTIECSVWEQDCPLNEKCMPWADDGGNAWNATRCSRLDPDPDQLGEECSVEGSGVSGMDSCDLGHMCWNVDVATNLGTCVAFCTGSEAMPMCDPEGTACSISNQGVLIVCLPLCNPLAPEDCAPDEGCYASGDVFHCAPDASGEMGGVGDSCEFLNACEAGLACADAASVPGCTGSTGCCTAFCRIGDDAACLAGQTCVPFYEMGEAPDMCLEDVGICTAQ
jgi:hypothetical protein